MAAYKAARSISKLRAVRGLKRVKLIFINVLSGLTLIDGIIGQDESRGLDY
jgi:hypothetical protein